VLQGSKIVRAAGIQQQHKKRKQKAAAEEPAATAAVQAAPFEEPAEKKRKRKRDAEAIGGQSDAEQSILNKKKQKQGKQRKQAAAEQQASEQQQQGEEEAEQQDGSEPRQRQDKPTKQKKAGKKQSRAADGGEGPATGDEDGLGDEPDTADLRWRANTSRVRVKSGAFSKAEKETLRKAGKRWWGYCCMARIAVQPQQVAATLLLWQCHEHTACVSQPLKQPAYPATLHADSQQSLCAAAAVPHCSTSPSCAPAPAAVHDYAVSTGRSTEHTDWLYSTSKSGDTKGMWKKVGGWLGLGAPAPVQQLWPARCLTAAQSALLRCLPLAMARPVCCWRWCWLERAAAASRGLPTCLAGVHADCCGAASSHCKVGVVCWHPYLQ
jgi:hypothetical protein